MNQQLSIDFCDGPQGHARPAQPLPGARKRDPATSHAAAASAASLSSEHHAAILVALARGPLGKDGIASSARLTGVQVCRRLPELTLMGMVEPTGRTVLSDSGRAEREFRLKPAAA